MVHHLRLVVTLILVCTIFSYGSAAPVPDHLGPKQSTCQQFKDVQVGQLFWYEGFLWKRVRPIASPTYIGQYTNAACVYPLRHNTPDQWCFLPDQIVNYWRKDQYSNPTW